MTRGTTWVLVGAGLLLLSRKNAGAVTLGGQSPGLLQSLLAPRPGSAQGRAQTPANAPKNGGGSSPFGGGAPGLGGRPAGGRTPLVTSIDNLFGTSILSDWLANQETVAPDLNFQGDTFLASDPQLTDIFQSFNNESSGVPQFGGDPSLQFDSNGLIVDPSTGLPFGQAGPPDPSFFDTSAGSPDDPNAVPPDDFNPDDFSF